MQPAAVRYHGLDAMRAWMMLLGLVLHSMASYTAVPMGSGWPFKDAHHSAIFDLPIFVIHLFRMPAFFAVGGFFAAMLAARDGVSGFVRNRARRILLPLAVFWLPAVALTGGGFLFAVSRQGVDPLAFAREQTATGAPPLMHLWFLWYLAIYCGLAALIMRLAGSRQVDAELASRLTTSWWAPFVWTATTTLLLLPTPHQAIETDPTLFPHPRALAGYGVFFVFGWLLYRGRDEMHRLARFWSRDALLMLLAAVVMWNVALMFNGNRALDRALGCALIALLTWMLVLAVFGVFTNYADRESPRMRYLSDASYWSYIVHLPVVLFAAGLLAPLPLHAFLKFALVLAVTTTFCLLTYHHLVRHTRIGELLNGRRSPKPAEPSYLGAM